MTIRWFLRCKGVYPFINLNSFGQYQIMRLPLTLSLLAMNTVANCFDDNPNLNSRVFSTSKKKERTLTVSVLDPFFFLININHINKGQSVIYYDLSQTSILNSIMLPPKNFQERTFKDVHSDATPFFI